MADWPGIKELRDACYRRWGMPVQERGELSWIISEANGRIVAAVGYSDEVSSQWTILDWYAEEGPLGKRAGSAILKLLVKEADAQEKMIVGVSCFQRFISVALKRGFKFVGVAIARQPGGQGCHQQ